MKYINFRTEVQEMVNTITQPNGQTLTHTEHIPVAIGTCPSCGEILFVNNGMNGEKLHLMIDQDFAEKHITTLYCGKCGQECGIGPVIDGQVISEEVVNEPSGENAETATADK